MEYYSKEISNLIAELSDLPSIGNKSAQRLAFHILGMDEEKVNDLANAIVQARKNVRYCKECFTLTDEELCPICANPKRNKNIIMVVEDTRDLAAYEKTGKFDGVYLADGWHWPWRYKAKGAYGAIAAERCRGSHRGHQFIP